MNQLTFTFQTFAEFSSEALRISRDLGKIHAVKLSEAALSSLYAFQLYTTGILFVFASPLVNVDQRQIFLRTLTDEHRAFWPACDFIAQWRGGILAVAILLWILLRNLIQVYIFGLFILFDRFLETIYYLALWPIICLPMASRIIL